LDRRRFPSFRPIQLEAIEQVVYGDDPRRMDALVLPTGGGKSLFAAAVGLLTGLKTTILTHTKSLMAQYLHDLKNSGLVEIKGMSNYDCPIGGNCRDGKELGCTIAKRAACGSGPCPYSVAKGRAMGSQLVLSNYAYWFASGGVGGDASTFTGTELLVCDEGHFTPNILSDFIGFTMTEREVEKFSDPLGEDMDKWSALGKLMSDEVDAELRTTRMELELHEGDQSKCSRLLRDIVKLQHTADKAYKLSTVNDQDWVCEAKSDSKFGRRWKFDIIWPGKYAHSTLFQDVGKIIIMSATIRRKTMGLLGVKQDDYHFHEWKPIFPAQRCPVYYFPPLVDVIREGKPVKEAVKVVRATPSDQLKLWVEHIDQIIDQRMDRRIVVLTTSYAYQVFIREESRHGTIMVGNTGDPDSESAMEVFERFIKTPPPVVLCSPSFGTGWDFKMQRAEVLIISKIPLRVPGSASKLMAARLARDKEYGNYETMQDIVQAKGRGQRSEIDRCEVLICDGSWGWFGRRNQHLAPMGFVPGVRMINQLPPRPEKL
jgi:Rad3-related DNA helicase